MFSHRIKLFSLFGFEVRVDASWLLLAALVAWTFAEGVFPELVPNLNWTSYWWMALAATIGLFLSIIFHETAHSLVARHYGMHIRGITLFIFGGVAEMVSEPSSARAEFLMALAGPVASLVLAAALFLLVGVADQFDGTKAVAGVLWYLGLLNGMLALFNIVPAFPLDGGRMLRATLWAWRGDIAWATRIAAAAGELFGILLIVLGVLEIMRGDFVGGIWRCLIGLFLRAAASASYQQTIAQRLLGDVSVAQVMTSNPIVVAPNVSIAEFIDGYVYRFHHREFPVAQDGKVIGTIGTRQAAPVERSRWTDTPVSQVMLPCSAEDTISSDAQALAALAQMSGSSRNRLFVLKGDLLVGILSLRDLMEFLSVKLELVGSGADTVAGRSHQPKSNR
jgi:Zn-dependent protease/predicted transcriptional regulator